LRRLAKQGTVRSKSSSCMRLKSILPHSKRLRITRRRLSSLKVSATSNDAVCSRRALRGCRGSGVRVVYGFHEGSRNCKSDDGASYGVRAVYGSAARDLSRSGRSHEGKLRSAAPHRAANCGAGYSAGGPLSDYEAALQHGRGQRAHAAAGKRASRDHRTEARAHRPERVWCTELPNGSDTSSITDGGM